MGGRWTGYVTRWSYFAIFILVLGIHGVSSLNSEAVALLEFRAKVEFDQFGALGDWNPNDFEPCQWHGVDCVDGNVHIINLGGQSIEGTLSPALGNLSHLRYLDLSDNNMYGTIPPQLGQLKALEVLNLSNNNFSGTIPIELGELNSLKRLLLCNNKFERSIPGEIKKLNMLTDLSFDEILSTEASSINRKFGLWLKCRTEGSQRQFHHSCNNVTNSPKQELLHSINEQMNNARRVLVEQSTSNLQATPPKIRPPPSSQPFLPSRSCGSYSAVPGKKVSPTHVPTDGPQQKHNADNKTSSVTPYQPTDGILAKSLSLLIGILVAIFILIVAVVLFFVFRTRAARTMAPWKTGLSGQLQKAFITGVPKLNRSELVAACEDFSNIIYSIGTVATIYKGTLSSGVEIAVVSTTISSFKDWTKRAELTFRKKIDSLSRVNHKNFVNLIGYCEEDEPFTRMMVFEYSPNGQLSEHLHVEDVEHLDWGARMRIIMGTAYCLQYMHELNPPVPHFNLTSKEIVLTDDYAAKIADVGFWAELVDKSNETAKSVSDHSKLPPLADVETNVHSFGLMLLEIITGKHTYSEEDGHLMNWAAQYLNDTKTLSNLIDPTLKSFKDNELSIVCEVIKDCTQHETRKRPTMKEVIQKLRQELDISAEAATPRLSPLWWAELEILSQEAA